MIFYFFFFNDTATTEIYTLSLHDALPIWPRSAVLSSRRRTERAASSTTRSTSLVVDIRRIASTVTAAAAIVTATHARSEEHTSELQSRQYLVCRLLLEKKKKITSNTYSAP